MGVITTLARKAAGIFVKKVALPGPDGAPVTRVTPRGGIRGAGWIVLFLLAWHFVIQPVLSYHFPQYSFPVLDFGWLSGIFLGG